MSENQKITEEELLSLLCAKDERGYRYLYKNYAKALFGVISRIVQDADRSQDVLQDVFVKIWNNVNSYERGKGTLFTWMINISRNAAIDSNRSKHVKYKNQVSDTFVDSVKSVSMNEATNMIGLTETIQKLKPDYQELIQKIYIEGYTQQEFSDMFEIPLGTVKTRTRSALMELRELLKERV
jgi:RNA polymerase sigma-70 factor (ECF subfamily)